MAIISFVSFVSFIADGSLRRYIPCNTRETAMTKMLDRPVLPSADDAALAKEASRRLARQEGGELRVQLDDGSVLRLPKAVSDLLYHVLTETAKGNAVTLIPVHAVLTTQEAADYLNVSRPFLIRLLEQGKLPFEMVGTHRRVRFADLEDFRRKSEEKRKATMDQLAAQAQELGMGY
jgi:excisionase family DNA binding protein